ncbi:DNA-directed RNA polymerase subunit beta' [Candidatus Liberibacter americanus]|uniref:DNA-directed RNA polymerase subunit beta' n=1 Tax=Candidatus Liberibacter americanus str. Sao Paulo TaxID=1261131 RepID=U6B7I1_9HYPH|nr:DNA-directed RNA polymerase subunit beta' [Candidatus Liberibacter americanus]AHA27821.1 DNA-directed RNA polymerase beta' subunit [Candidatus Liberibacter americanus str. Sao Paulo]EMS35988.1 DNA-directed RNA polymerase subunit beta' [Candidatus Liberibacter americanus PW_SP]
MQQGIMRFFNPWTDDKDFDSIRISIASPEKILSLSYGEIKKPETINYRTFKPERDGLFCARIFGPMADYECLCGKYKRMKYKGVVCEKCGVEVTLSSVRRDRMAHIRLAAPVAHPWFLKSLPSRISILLDMSLKNIERVLYFESYVVVDPGLSPLEKYQLLTEEEYLQALNDYSEDQFIAMMGADAIRELLISLDLEKLAADLRSSLIKDVSIFRRKKTMKRLKIVDNFLNSGNRPEWMIMTVIPVIPPDLRPLVALDFGRFAASDLNDLYRRVIGRNNRLIRLNGLHAPDIIVRNEKRMLQEAVDALFDNGRHKRVITGANRRPLKSLSDMLKGKQGRFRTNLLGKRVDYSGRSVIVAGPELLLHQCGLPKLMALELFKPFLYAQLEKKGCVSTVKQAKKFVEKKKPEVWDALEEVVSQSLILLNRAPSLHRLSMQAFEPKIISGKAIQLHPLVCEGYNADFDGDQMAVHVLLSLEAQLEARVLMMSTNNILHPASGVPVVVPSQDMVLGLYYLSISHKGDPGEGMSFADVGEVYHALENKVVTLHSRILGRYTSVDADGNKVSKVYDTTPGRMIIGEILPCHYKISFDICNQEMTKKNISSMVDTVYRNCGQENTVVFCDRLMRLGFSYACSSGISFGKDDIIVPESKEKIIAEADKMVKDYEQEYNDGLITRGEKYNKVVELWGKATDKVTEEMMARMKEVEFDPETGRQKPMNSIFMMSRSGARGSIHQMRQLGGMRGLIAKPSGEIIETPIRSHFKGGLDVFEFFKSNIGGRKGLLDVVMRTASSGYLSRRLVDVNQNCVITQVDCGTDRGLTVRSIVDSGQVVSSLGSRILGRTTIENIINPLTNECIIEAGKLILESHVADIEELGIRSVRIRSPLTCESSKGICAFCYGRDLSRGKIINVGEAIGIIAAQSIGEPGTQLTMRTFHLGGAATVVDRSFIESSCDGKVKIKNCTVCLNSEQDLISMGRNTTLQVLDSSGEEQSSYRIMYGAKLFVNNGDSVKCGQRISEWDPHTSPIITEVSGTVEFEDLVDGLSVIESIGESTGIAKRKVIDWRFSTHGQNLKPAIVVKDENGDVIKFARGSDARWFLPVDAILSVTPGQKVSVGDVLARSPISSAKTKDITSGLPRVAELFEARRPKDNAMLAEISGTIRIKRNYKNKSRVLIEPFDESLEPVEYFIPKNKHFYLQDGDTVEKGDYIVEGNPAPHDILRIKGVEALASYLLNEIQEVYRLEGVVINDKHIEVVIRQMLQKVEIIDVGDSEYVLGDNIDRVEVEAINKELIHHKKKPVVFSPVLQGITKAALQTKSFISAASFQETTKVLTEAAIAGKVDMLEGLKENVIVGRLIPAGTGALLREKRRIAMHRDQMIVKEKNNSSNNTESNDKYVKI